MCGVLGLEISNYFAEGYKCFGEKYCIHTQKVITIIYWTIESHLSHYTV